ncbi:hypothetical protein GGX14DRAFT_388503 [Mycena pura]|uniref:Uncharacterized protein n=1 Tax=Mycena pura TaxID=153505 RepID=A0AAD6YK54_9AGAR|nr:hypothetical protein GGX14DRAFT_388503 [Mycena pura]
MSPEQGVSRSTGPGAAPWIRESVTSLDARRVINRFGPCPRERGSRSRKTRPAGRERKKDEAQDRRNPGKNQDQNRKTVKARSAKNLEEGGGKRREVAGSPHQSARFTIVARCLEMFGEMTTEQLAGNADIAARAAAADHITKNTMARLAKGSGWQGSIGLAMGIRAWTDRKWVARPRRLRVATSPVDKRVAILVAGNVWADFLLRCGLKFGHNGYLAGNCTV